MKLFNLKYALVIGITFILATIFSLFFIEENKQSRINYILEQHLVTLETYYKVLLHKQSSTADAEFKSTIENKEIMDLLKKANELKNKNNHKELKVVRDNMQKLLTSKYNILKIKGVLQYHFVFPDNKVFLRMHKPNKFGDDLTNIRTDFKKANSTLKNVKGFSQGRTAHGFRNVYPILTKDNQHLGAVEISFSSELLQDYFTEINQLHTHFIVRKDIFDSHAWKRDDLVLKYTQSAEHENFMLTVGSQHSISKCVVENRQRIDPIRDNINSKIALREPFSLYTIFNNISRVVSFYPIQHSISDETVAWIVSYKANPLIDDIIENTIWIKLFMLVFLATLSFFVYFLMTQKSILDQMVKEKTESLLITNKELEDSEEELKHINENLEILIQEEVSKNKQKDKMLFEQSKMASMGEMIGNIAHQWRQPLSAISASASGMIMQNDLGILETNTMEKNLNIIVKNSEYLSQTIDDFRDYIRGDSQKQMIELKNSIESFQNLVSSAIKKHEIDLQIEVEENFKFKCLANELNQCIINLFNNAKDAMENKKGKKIIRIWASKNDKEVCIHFSDNAGGIPDNIINKIFEPYFTTKHKSQGTGLGLHMVYKMIVEGMSGTIAVQNDTLEEDGTLYEGAHFIITLPIDE